MLNMPSWVYFTQEALKTNFDAQNDILTVSFLSFDQSTLNLYSRKATLFNQTKNRKIS